MYQVLHCMTRETLLEEDILVVENAQVKDRLFLAGAKLFAEKGFDSVSVREICKEAQTSSNMVHHYFGSKGGLFDSIVLSFTERVFAVPIRLLGKKIETKEEFATVMELFFQETLWALIEQRRVLHVIMKHDVAAPAMEKLVQKFVIFLSNSQSSGFVQRGFQPDLVSGFLMDRLASQVLYADQIKKGSGHDLFGDVDYRKRWVKSNINLFLFGLVVR